MKAPCRYSLSLISVAVLAGACSRKETAAPATAAATVTQPINAELQALQGTWEGSVVDGKGTTKNPDAPEASKRKPGETDLDFLRPGVIGSPQKSPEKITIVITGNSLNFHRDTDFWFETTIALPAGTNPKQLHATIKGCPPSQASSIGSVVVAIFKIENGTLTLATGNGDGEAPKSFEANGENGLNRYELRKVQSQMKNGEPPKTR